MQISKFILFDDVVFQFEMQLSQNRWEISELRVRAASQRRLRWLIFIGGPKSFRLSYVITFGVGPKRCPCQAGRND